VQFRVVALRTKTIETDHLVNAPSPEIAAAEALEFHWSPSFYISSCLCHALR